MIALLIWTIAQSTVPFTTVARGALSGVDDRRDVVVRTAEEWSRLRKEHVHADLIPSLPPGRMIVGVFLGTRSTGGYTVEIQRIVTTADGLVVQYFERRPEKGQITIQMLTAPYHLVSVAAQAAAVRFERVEAPK